MPLTDTAIRKAKAQAKPYRMFDGGGLYLEVSPSGGKLWRWKYRIAGVEQRLSLGVYPDVSLSEAGYDRWTRRTFERLFEEREFHVSRAPRAISLRFGGMGFNL